MEINYLLSLTVNEIERGVFPLRQLLENSLYYPACDLDGGVIRYCNQHFPQLNICSFVYVDYVAGEERLKAHLDDFRGYHLLATRALTPAEIGADRPVQAPRGIEPTEYNRYQDLWKPFARWAVYERDEKYGDLHGPERFSLLYLGAEGAAAYAGLYIANHIKPKAMAIIQPGTGFGFNWTDFRDFDAPLGRTVMMGSMPEYFFYGGNGDSDYEDLDWPDYHMVDAIERYSHVKEGRVTVWRIDD